METRYSLGNGQLRIERYCNGQLHAEYVPAIEIYNTNGICQYEYYNNGKRHNNFGPAIKTIFNNQTTKQEYWINNNKLAIM